MRRSSSEAGGLQGGASRDPPGRARRGRAGGAGALEPRRGDLGRVMGARSDPDRDAARAMRALCVSAPSLRGSMFGAITHVPTRPAWRRRGAGEPDRSGLTGRVARFGRGRAGCGGSAGAGAAAWSPGGLLADAAGRDPEGRRWDRVDWGVSEMKHSASGLWSLPRGSKGGGFRFWVVVCYRLVNPASSIQYGVCASTGFMRVPMRSGHCIVRKKEKCRVIGGAFALWSVWERVCCP